MAKRKILTSRLPATPCTPEMYAQVIELAELEGRSIAEIQRDAIALFFRRRDRKSVIKDSKPVLEGA